MDKELNCARIVLKQGKALLMPGGTIHMVRTTMSSIARGSNLIWERQLGNFSST